MPPEADDFELMGMWYTKDNRIAIVTDVDDMGLLTGVVSRNGRVYDCTWDQEQRSVTPFRYLDDLAIKLGE